MSATVSYFPTSQSFAAYLRGEAPIYPTPQGFANASKGFYRAVVQAQDAARLSAERHHAAMIAAQASQNLGGQSYIRPGWNLPEDNLARLQNAGRLEQIQNLRSAYPNLSADFAFDPLKTFF
jgi:hypothetical protein